jgi:hypothetical protein
VNGLAAADIRAPLRDLLLDGSIHGRRQASAAVIQSPRKAPSTTCH